MCASFPNHLPMNSTPSIINTNRPRGAALPWIALVCCAALAASCGRKWSTDDFSRINPISEAAAEHAMEALGEMGVGTGSRLAVWSAMPPEQESMMNAFREKVQGGKLDIVRSDVSEAAAGLGGVERTLTTDDGGLGAWLGAVEPVDAIVLFSPPTVVPKVPPAMRAKRPKILLVAIEFSEPPAMLTAGLADAAVISRPDAVAPEGSPTRQQIKDLLQVVK